MLLTAWIPKDLGLCRVVPPPQEDLERADRIDRMMNYCAIHSESVDTLSRAAGRRQAGRPDRRDILSCCRTTFEGFVFQVLAKQRSLVDRRRDLLGCHSLLHEL
jgi:hypothetical protein